ncbi:hypothetical protein [Nocardia sp.]|uniref:hypothetical protein n=1 Tax=Nocardia sp. TaxID=1821 RepID=UPI00260663CB|nr:hypothetical protein [Nocardia sp.]
MGKRDNNGVLMANVMFVTNHGSPLHLDKAGMSVPILLIFAVWSMGTALAIYALGYGPGLQWMNLMAEPVRGVAHALTSQLPISLIMTLCVTVGALFAAICIARGMVAKGMTQLLFMFFFALMLLGTKPLSSPVDDIVSSTGILAEAGDVGDIVALSLNGDNNPDPAQLNKSMEATAVTNEFSDVVQVWNFGHVLKGACADEWVAGMNAQDEDKVMSSLKTCDPAAHHSADNPSAGQIATGVLLLITMIINLGFNSAFMISIIGTGLTAVYWALVAMVSLISSAYLPGPPQTVAFQGFFHGAYSAVKMGGLIGLVGAYQLFMGDLYQQAQGNTIQIAIVAAIFELVAVIRYRRLLRAWGSADSWFVNGFALAGRNGIHFGFGPSGGSGGGSGGGTALGMGTAGANGHGLGMLTRGAAVVAAINTSPVAEAFFRRQRPLGNMSIKQRRMAESQVGVWTKEGFGGAGGIYVQSMMNRELYGYAARKAIKKHGGNKSALGISAGVQAIVDAGGEAEAAYGVLYGGGLVKNKEMVHYAVRSWNWAKEHSEDETLKYKGLGQVASAFTQAENSFLRMIRGDENGRVVETDIATLQASAYRFQRWNEEEIHLEGQGLSLAREYMREPSKHLYLSIQKLENGDPLVETDYLYGRIVNDEVLNIRNKPLNIDRDTAARMTTWIANSHRKEVAGAAEAVVDDAGDNQKWRLLRKSVNGALNTDAWASGTNRVPFHSPHPPDFSKPVNPWWRRSFSANKISP